MRCSRTTRREPRRRCRPARPRSDRTQYAPRRRHSGRLISSMIGGNRVRRATAGRGDTATPDAARAAATPKHWSSCHGAAMICRPIGKLPGAATGAATTGQADAGNGLGQQPETGSQRQSLARKFDPLGADRCRRNRCGGSDQHIHVGEQRSHLLLVPRANALGLEVPRGRHQGARQKAVARMWFHVTSTVAQGRQVQRAAFGGRDRERGRATQCRMG